MLKLLHEKTPYYIFKLYCDINSPQGQCLHREKDLCNSTQVRKMPLFSGLMPRDHRLDASISVLKQDRNLNSLRMCFETQTNEGEHYEIYG